MTDSSPKVRPKASPNTTRSSPEPPPKRRKFVPEHPTSRALVTYRYLLGRPVKHAMTLVESLAGHSSLALCGLWGFDHGPWLGTGSQNEYDEVDRLPLCKNCEVQLAPPKEIPSVPSGESPGPS